MNENQPELELGEIENDKVVPKIEHPEYAKFKIQDISKKIKEKLFKMTENELKENGIMTIDDEVSFFIKNTVEEKSLAKGLSPEQAKEQGQQVKS